MNPEETCPSCGHPFHDPVKCGRCGCLAKRGAPVIDGEVELAAEEIGISFT